MDTVMDKAFSWTMLIRLLMFNDITNVQSSLWAVATVTIIFIDAGLLMAKMIEMLSKLTPKPNGFGKAKMVFQLITIGALIVMPYTQTIGIDKIWDVLSVIMIICAIGFGGGSIYGHGIICIKAIKQIYTPLPPPTP